MNMYDLVNFIMLIELCCMLCVMLFDVCVVLLDCIVYDVVLVYYLVELLNVLFVKCLVVYWLMQGEFDVLIVLGYWLVVDVMCYVLLFVVIDKFFFLQFW